MPEWFEDEGFWTDLYDFVFSPDKFVAAAEEIDSLLKLTQFQGHSVLDMACGPGRHSIALARKGYIVTGVDRSEFLLAKARSNAGETESKVEWVTDDIRTFCRPDSFDLAINLFTSFGYFDETENFRVLQNAFRSLSPGGTLVIDTVGKERVARYMQQAVLHELPEGKLLLERPRVIRDWSCIQNEWILIDGTIARRYSLRHMIYSGRELESLLRDAGFAAVALYGDLNGSEYGMDAVRLVAVARKS